MNINFQTIEIMLAIKKYNSISGASKELYISEPALSKQIRRYEDALGYPLIIRNSSGCTLTKAGEILVDKGLEIIRLRDLMLDEMNTVSKPVRNSVLRFGIANCYSEAFLSKIMPSFISLHPEIKIELIINKTDTLEKMCLNDEVDIILTQTEYCDKRLVTTPVLKEETVAFVPVAYSAYPDLKPYLDKGSIPLKCLESYPYAKGQGHERYIAYTQQFLDEADFKPNTVFTSESWSTIMSLIENRMCYSIMPDIFDNNDKIVKLHIESKLPTIRTLALGYKPHDKLPYEFSEFIECARKNLI